MFKKAIVLGATGGTGKVITSELMKRGVQTVIFGRSRSKLEEVARELGRPDMLILAEGNVFDPESIIQAAQGAEVIFHAASIPYNQMTTRLLPMGEAVMEAANQLGIKVVAVDGIYPYGRSTSTGPIDETYPKRPHTRKGKTKLAFENMFFDPKWSHAQGLIVRLPDYYGPTANEASYLGGTLEAIAAGKPAAFIGNMHIPREYVYLPDAAEMIVELAVREEAYGQNWHIPGPGMIAGRDIVKIARRASGHKKPVIALGRGVLSVLGLFVPVFKEIVEMLYLTREPLVLSGKKYEQQIGPIPVTPFEQGITETVKSIMERNLRS